MIGGYCETTRNLGSNDHPEEQRRKADLMLMVMMAMVMSAVAAALDFIVIINWD